MNPNEELQLLDATLNFLTSSAITGGDSGRMEQVKQYHINRLQTISKMLQEQAKAPQMPPIPGAE